MTTIMESLKKVLIGLFIYALTAITITGWAYGNETCMWIVVVGFIIALVAMCNYEED